MKRTYLRLILLTLSLMLLSEGKTQDGKPTGTKKVWSPEYGLGVFKDDYTAKYDYFIYRHDSLLYESCVKERDSLRVFIKEIPDDLEDISVASDSVLISLDAVNDSLDVISDKVRPKFFKRVWNGIVEGSRYVVVGGVCFGTGYLVGRNGRP